MVDAGGEKGAHDVGRLLAARSADTHACPPVMPQFRFSVLAACPARYAVAARGRPMPCRAMKVVYTRVEEAGLRARAGRAVPSTAASPHIPVRVERRYRSASHAVTARPPPSSFLLPPLPENGEVCH